MTTTTLPNYSGFFSNTKYLPSTKVKTIVCDGIRTVSHWDMIPNDCVKYVPSGRSSHRQYKTQGQCISICKRLISTGEFVPGESYCNFYIVQNDILVEDGRERTWQIFFN